MSELRGKSEQLTQELTTALELAARPATARKGLAFLFPKAEEVLKTYIRSEPTDAWERRKGRRISISDFGQTYFRMDPQKAAWSRSEIDQIFSQDDPIVGMKMMGKRLVGATPEDRPRLRRLFLDELRTFFRNSPVTSAWLLAVIEYSVVFIKARDEEIVYWFAKDNSERLRAAIHDGLRQLDEKDRAAIFIEAIPKASDLSLLCDVVSIVAGWVRKRADDQHQPLQVTFGDRAGEVRDALVEQVRKFASAHRIWQQAQPDRVLWFWWGSTETDEVKDFTTFELRFPESLRGMFETVVQLVHSTAGNYERVGKSWSEIIDINRLAEIARDWISDPTLSDKDRKLAQRYVAAFEHEDRFPS